MIDGRHVEVRGNAVHPRRLGLVAWLVLALLSCVACERRVCDAPAAQQARGRGEDFVGQPPAPRIAVFLDSLAKQGISGVALIARGDEVLLRTGFGLAERSSQSPNTVSTVFDIGSIAKTFTAAAVFRLESEGKLQTRAPISRYLEGVPPDKSTVTVLQLLNHGSGLENYLADSDFEALGRNEAVARCLSLRLRWTPGDVRDGYSNAGYALLAAIVEAASGVAFTDYVRRAVLEPLQLERTGWFCDSRLPALHYAHAYEGDEEAGSACCWRLTWALLGGGGMVSSLDDLHRLLRAIVEGPFFSAEARTAMQTAPAEHYTAGLQLQTDAHGTWLQKGGSSIGFSGMMRYHLERQVYVIFLLNAWIPPYDGRVHIDVVAPRLSKLALEGF